MQTVLKNCTIAGEPYKVHERTKKVILKGGEFPLKLSYKIVAVH